MKSPWGITENRNNEYFFFFSNHPYFHLDFQTNYWFVAQAICPLTFQKKGQTKKQLVLSLVETPKTLNSDKRTSKKLFSYITEEIRKNKSWTQNCSTALQESPSALFHFDRLQYLLANAFGDQRIRIAMNPKMLCYHPDCYNVKGKNPISMHDLNSICRYVEHLILLGNAMLARFEAVYKEPFSNNETLDKKAASPFSLMEPLPLLETNYREYTIKHNFEPGKLIYLFIYSLFYVGIYIQSHYKWTIYAEPSIKSFQ